MYPLSTPKTHFSQDALEFVLSRDFGNNLSGGSDRAKLRSIADLAFDLCGKIQKSEKLRKLGQLGKKGEEEFDSNIRLVGVMVHILRSYGYEDSEMMGSLEKKYQAVSMGISGKKV